MASRCSERTTSTYRPLRSVTIWSCRYFAVSRPAPVRRARNGARRAGAGGVTNIPEGWAGLVAHVSGGFDGACDRLRLRRERGRAVRDRGERWTAGAPAAVATLSTEVSRREKPRRASGSSGWPSISSWRGSAARSSGAEIASAPPRWTKVAASAVSDRLVRTWSTSPRVPGRAGARVRARSGRATPKLLGCDRTRASKDGSLHGSSPKTTGKR